MFWHALMERAVTYSDHSTTVTTRYFTQSTHKSYGPMTQLLPGPQCPNVTHVPTVLLQTSSPPVTPASPLLFPPSFHAQPSLSLSTSTPSPPPFLFLSPALPCLSVCVSPLSCLALTPSPPCPPPPLARSCLSLVLCPLSNICLQTGIPSPSRCGSCPLHVAWGWTFEESSRHLSLSPALSLNAAANPPQIASVRLEHWPRRGRRETCTRSHTENV